jgi:hypothetical protein
MTIFCKRHKMVNCVRFDLTALKSLDGHRFQI